ncbi:MAG TPA: hypothetical protein PKN62_03285 [bacterium]|nr:hypothetical protein [bacterium]
MSGRIIRKISYYNSYFFIWLTVAIGSFIILESLWPGSVRAYLNLSFWLLFWSISATIEVLLSNKNS